MEDILKNEEANAAIRKRNEHEVHVRKYS